MGILRSFPRAGSIAALLWAALSLHAGPSRAEHVGKSLAEAILELQEGGLKVIFTSNVVRPDMMVEKEPTATEPRQILDELLKPHGLVAQEGPRQTIVVVRRETEGFETTYSLLGSVQSRPTRRPVGGATIRLVEAGLEVSTTEDGNFRFDGLEPGSFTVEVIGVGFLTETVDQVVVAAAEDSRLTVLLEPVVVMQEKLEVTPSRVSLMRADPQALFSLSRDELKALPHLGNDFFRAMTLLPGLTSNDISAQFHVRGGRRDETQILLDGQELYQSFHLQDFDNALSIVMPDIVGSVDLTSGGFPVNHGDRMSGVLDMTTARPSEHRQFRLGLSFLAAHAGGTGTFDENRGSWMAVGRRGATDLLGRVFANEEPKYWDLFGKLDYQFNPKNSLRLNLLHTDDSFDITETDEEDFKEIATDYSSSYAWLTHQYFMRPDLYFDTAVSYSRVDRDRNGLELEEDARFVVRDIRDLEVAGVRQAWNFEASERHFLRWGFELRDFDTTYDYTNFKEFDSPVVPPSEPVLFQETFNEDHHSLYVADRIKILLPLTAEIGLRYDDYTQTDEKLVSPRFNLAWAVGRSSALRFAVGRFNQSQRPYELQVEDGETTFSAVERSNHWIVGYERLFPGIQKLPGLALRIEAYHRDVDNPRPRYENLFEPFNNFPEVEPDRVLIEADEAVAEGIELFLRGRLGSKTGWWINYTYATTEDLIDGRWVPRKIDQRHALNLDFDVLFGEHWTFNAAWRFHTGWPTTAVGITEIEDEEGEIDYEIVLGPINAERLADYHRLDVRVSRNWELSWGVLTAFADIQNLYDRKNESGFDIAIDEGELVVNTEQWAGIIPSIGVSIEF